MLLLQNLIEVAPILQEAHQVNHAIAPLLGVALGASALQTGLGIWQSIKGSKESKEEKQAKMAQQRAMAQKKAVQQDLIKRAKSREAFGGAAPGLERAEEKMMASAASQGRAFREMGNQASYQDFLNQSLYGISSQLADLGVKQDQWAYDKSLAVDEAIAGMKDIYAGEAGLAGEQYAAKLAQREAMKGAGIQNIAGGLTSAASSAAMFGSAGGGAGARTAGAGAGAGYNPSTYNAGSSMQTTFQQGLSGSTGTGGFGQTLGGGFGG